MQRTVQGKDLEVILTVKMETRHPVVGLFGRKFSAFVIIVELWRPEVARPQILWAIFALFWKKRSLSNCLYYADHAQDLPGPAPHIWLTLFQISSKLVHFRRSYCWMREGHFCPVEYLQYRLLESIIIQMSYLPDMMTVLGKQLTPASVLDDCTGRLTFIGSAWPVCWTVEDRTTASGCCSTVMPNDVRACCNWQ